MVKSTTKWLRPSRAQAVSPNFTSRSSRSVAVLRIRSGLGDPPPLALATPALASEASGVLVHHQHPIPILKDTKHMLNLQKLETVEIPLSKLTLWDGNVRTTGAEEGLDELIASIRSIGLLQSLVVKKASRGTFRHRRRKTPLSRSFATGRHRRCETLLPGPLPHRA
jgi:ParB-like nuclease domain